jgi:sarcosine oxidase
MKKFPQFRLKEGARVFFEKNGGFVRPERCIEAQLALAKKYGASIHVNEKYLRYECSDDGKKVRVITDKAEYTAAKLIFTAGPWIRELIPEFKNYFRIYRQVLCWFSVQGSIEPFLPQNFPVFMWEGNDGLYGFPANDATQEGIKVASEQYLVTTTPGTMDHTVSQAEIRALYDRHLREQFPNVTEKCVKASACLYTVTPDANFIIDIHPKHPQIIIASPCSGHGFKHSAAIGEVLAELVTEGKSKIDISAFTIGRLLEK